MLKSERELSNIKKKVPGPTDYAPPAVTKYKQESPKPVFTKSKRDTTKILMLNKIEAIKWDIAQKALLD